MGPEHVDEFLGSMKVGHFLTSKISMEFSTKALHHGIT